MKRSILGLVVCASIVVSFFVSCGIATQNRTSKEYREELTLEVYDDFSNFEGEQTGWFAKIIKDRFNIKLVIDSPNGENDSGDELQTRIAAGNVGDLILVGTADGRFQELIDKGLVLDMTEYMEDQEVVETYGDAIEVANQNYDGFYTMPYWVSSNDATEPSEGTEPTFGPYVRWDYYRELGYPEVTDCDSLLDMLEQMQALAREKEGRDDIYTFSFFDDWDGSLMICAKQPVCMYGYDEIGFMLNKFDGSESVDILSDNSPYIQVLEMFYEANQRGLVDPDSTTQNYEDLEAKYAEGAILFSPWPWASKKVFNTVERAEQGIGYEMIPVSDMTIFSYGNTPLGTGTQAIAIGSNTKDPQRVADFIAWLYSPEGIECNEQAHGAQGPQGLTWDLDEDGNPYLTEFGKLALPCNDVEVPEEWGGGTWKSGSSWLNFRCVNVEDADPDAGNAKYDYTTWDSYIEDSETALSLDWSEHMDGAKTDMEYLLSHNQIGVASGANYVIPSDDATIAALREQMKSVVVSKSWEMAFAADQTEFEALEAEMVETVKGLGYDEVLIVDQENIDLQNAARKEELVRD